MQRRAQQQAKETTLRTKTERRSAEQSRPSSASSREKPSCDQPL